jgi:hypothetical protein
VEIHWRGFRSDKGPNERQAYSFMRKVGPVPARPYLCALIIANINLSRPWGHGVDSLNKGNSMRNRVNIYQYRGAQ